MIELRNKQYASVIDCVALEALEEGCIIELVDQGTGKLPGARKATNIASCDVWGPRMAHWINPRSTAFDYDGKLDGLEYTAPTAAAPDHNHFIPAGAVIQAVGGNGMTEVRLFPESLDASLDTLPAFGTLLKFKPANGKLCATNAAGAVDLVVARVVENDGASISVMLGFAAPTPHPEA